MVFLVGEFAFECNRRAFIELRMLQCFIFKITGSNKKNCYNVAIQYNTRAHSPLISDPRGSVIFTRSRLSDRCRCRSEPEALDTQEISRISNGPLGLRRFSLCKPTLNTHTHAVYYLAPDLT